MGQIEINHTGSGGGVVLSSDGTNLLLGGSAVGGGADLYTANESSPSAQPSATGSNAIAIGDSAVASGTDSLAGPKSRASGSQSFAAAIADNSSTYGAKNTNTVALGYRAKASQSASIAIGYMTNATGTNSHVFGQYNNATSNYSMCLGTECDATNLFSTAMGVQSLSAIKGKLAYSAGRFAADGDAQGGTFILRSDTTDATAEAMTTSNSTAAADNQIVVASDTCIMFSGTVVAMQNGAADQGGWEIKGLLKNDGGTTTLVNSNIQTFSGGNSWAVALSADNTNNALKVQVTGEASHNIRWVANIQTSEVTYA